jgi:hypothetical protein
LNFGEVYSITFSKKLIAVISHNNYYSQFYHPFFNWNNNRLLPLIRQFFLIANEEIMGCETADSNVPPPVKISSARI